MNNRRIGTFVVFAILLAAVVLLNRRKVELISQDGFEIVKISDNGYELRSVIKLKNNNLLSSTIRTINQKFYINGALVSIIHTQLDQGIPGLKETELPMMVRFEGGGFLHAAGDSLAGLSPYVVEVKGDIEYRSLTGSGKLLVETQGSAK